MASWIKKASSLIDKLDQAAAQQVSKGAAQHEEEEESDTDHEHDEDDVEEEIEAAKADSTTEDATPSNNESPDSANSSLTTPTTQTSDGKPATTGNAQTHTTLAPPSTQEAKVKSKKAKAKSSKSNTQNGDYVALKKQYEGMVKLWNQERANLKKAQQLLRNQKDSFKEQQYSLGQQHKEAMQELEEQHIRALSVKENAMKGMEASLLRVKEERNTNIEGSASLNDTIQQLEADKLEVLREKSAMQKEKQKQIEVIRAEFDTERANWDKERKILTKNFEREAFLESENVEYTNALARVQSSLQQKELENSRLKGELKWLRMDKDELSKTNDILSEENVSSQKQLDALQRSLKEKTKELMTANEETALLSKQTEQINQLQQELEEVKTNHVSSVADEETRDEMKVRELERRVKRLTSSLLEKQTELDMVVSRRNEYKMKLDKMEEEGGALYKKDIESGATVLNRRSALSSSRNPLLVLRNGRRHLTSYKSLNYGIGVFDRIGLEVARVLKNRPWVRVLIVVYIMLLHLWCFIVLHFSMSFNEDLHSLPLN